jgi:hypothetical protein
MFVLFTLVAALCTVASAQTTSPEKATPPTTSTTHSADKTELSSTSTEDEPKRNQRMLWIIPNARSQPISAQSHPLTTREKWNLVKKDALDPMSAVTAAVVGGISMARDLHPEFGWGPPGAAKYWSTALAGQEVSKVMVGGVFPTLLHQDPRFFMRGTGSFSSRVGYALTRSLVTRGDNGHAQFNTSEMAGVAVAASAGNIWFSGSRGPGPTASRFGIQIGMNAGFNVLKEFWPDIQRKLTGNKK